VEDVTPKAALYETFAAVGKALGNPARLLLLELLAQGERGVEELAEAAGMRLSNTSAQLKALSAAGLVAGRRSGPKVIYALAEESVGALVEQVKDFAAARLADAERAARAYLGDVGALEPVDLNELAERIEGAGVLVLDVRPAVEYAAGHIPGALSIPQSELAARLAELPADAEIVAYCRGRYCVMAPEAVRLLREHGYRARLLDGGLPEWRRTGHAVAAGATA